MTDRQEETENGAVVGYEMKVVCPECGNETKTRRASTEETVVCGEDVPEDERFGCGQELEVDVRVC